MKASSKCRDLIVKFEGFKPSPYICPAGKWTIGYGFTHYPDGRPVTRDDKPITQAQADAMLITLLAEYEAPVSAMLRVPVSQGEFDALVDFAYNAGVENLRNSTLLRRLNSGDRMGAADEFDRWVYGGGVRLKGLEIRRKAEHDLFVGFA